MSKIESALATLFQKQRIVFWYDPDGELRTEYEQLQLDGVEKIALHNNAMGVKYRVLREQPKDKFLLYFDHAQPDDLHNWLLDVQLAHTVFHADQISLWLAEIGLGPEYRELAQEHREFFSSAARREALKIRKPSGDSHHGLRLKMIAVCLGTIVEANLENILFALMSELALAEQEKYDLLVRFNLAQHLWQSVSLVYGYQAETAHIMDFAINAFEVGLELALGKESGFSQETYLFLNRWQDSSQHRRSFELLSDKFDDLLNIRQKLSSYNLDDLLEFDLFRFVDERVLELLMKALMDRTLNENEYHEVIRRRSATYWYAEHFRSMYAAIDTAASLQAQLINIHFHIDSIADGFQKYIKTWFKVDQYYRQYVYYVRQSNQSGFFMDLNDVVEKQYNNFFLRPLNDNWQQVVDANERWLEGSLDHQDDFYDQYVNKILLGNAKAAVIISDALRFEIAEELSHRVQAEGRFSTDLGAMQAMLPSYTQLGMAALLPHQYLQIQSGGSVAVDGISASGKENRAKILDQYLAGNSKAFTAAEFGGLSMEERRGIFRENQVIYLYHNQIDAVGDKLSEERTVEAVETTIVELIDLIKNLRNANFTKILVTADHGFIYQHQALDESDFADTEGSGEEIFSRNRRYVVGRGLQPSMSLKHYSAEQVGLSGDYEINLAKSINRMRLKGASIQFVHGGASLQEIVIPVLLVTQERTQAGDVRGVEIDRINGTSKTISTGQITVTFYQLEAVSSKVLPRKLRAGIYAQDGTLISNVHTLQFSFESENPRDREIKVTFHLGNESEKYNKQMVAVRLEEQIPNTNKYMLYKEWQYWLDKARFALF